jgi:hypothetical protein
MTHTHDDDVRMTDPGKLMTHVVKKHPDVGNDDLYTAIRGGVLGELHDKQHPETVPGKVRFKMDLHYDNVEGLFDYLTDPPLGVFPPVRRDIARQIAEAQPFYEVTVEVEYDTATRKFKLIKAEL